MKKIVKYTIFALVLFTAFVIWDCISYSNPNWILNMVQTLLTVLVYFACSILFKK